MTKTVHGRSCRHGHGTLRYAADNVCIECSRRSDARRKAAKTQLQRTRYAANREKSRVSTKRWNSNNPEKNRIRMALRRARKLNATPCWLTMAQKKKMAEIYGQAVRLGLTVDHIVPLKGETVCGLHVPWNLQLLTLSENSSKSNSLGG